MARPGTRLLNAADLGTVSRAAIALSAAAGNGATAAVLAHIQRHPAGTAEVLAHLPGLPGSDRRPEASFAYLNGQSMVELLCILGEVRARGHLALLSAGVGNAQGVNRPRLQVAINAAAGAGSATVEQFRRDNENGLMALPPDQSATVLTYVRTTRPGAVPQAERIRTNESAEAHRKYEEFQAFARQRMAALERMANGTEYDTHRQILSAFLTWIADNHQRRSFLTARPMDVYEHLGQTAITRDVSSQVERERRAPQDPAARAAKLEEFWAVAHQLWGHSARTIRSIRLPSEGRAVLIRESPVLQEAYNALAGQLMDWAMEHSQRADFTLFNPLVVLGEIADRPLNRLQLALGQQAPLDAEWSEIPPAERTGWQIVTELIIGFIPVIGEVTDLSQALGGVDLWGERLGPGERAVMAVGVLIPFVPGSALRRGRRLSTEIAADLARGTGRRAGEFLPLIRAADSFRTADVELINRARAAIRAGRRVDPADVQALSEVMRRVSHDLRAPLVGAVRRGSRQFVEIPENTLRHVGNGHSLEMFDPVARWAEIRGNAAVTTTSIFPPGVASSDRNISVLMDLALDSREAVGAARDWVTTVRGVRVHVWTGAVPGDPSRVIVNTIYPEGGVSVTRAQIETWANDIAAGRLTPEQVREQLRRLF